MPQFLIAVLAVVLFATSGCGPVKPMTGSEFKGFCYQYTDGRQTGCSDIIAVCDEYTPVLGQRQSSLDACLRECQDIHAPQASRYFGTDCEGGSEFAFDWCQRYCRRAYPK
jgi:hypothetical protein